MILEGIVTTLGDGGSVNISPMGPLVSDDFRRLTLRPFQTSRTFRSLKAHGEGVFHVTDDVELLAKAAVGPIEAPVRPAQRVRGWILEGACRAYEFRVVEVDDRAERATLHAEIVRREEMREFFGFNRAKHAVVEAAVLASRVHILPVTNILAQLRDLDVLVTKTGGPAERRAFDFLKSYVESAREPVARARVVAGSRLHFGLLRPGEAGAAAPGAVARRFGGAGAMLQEPAIEVVADDAPAFEVIGPLQERAAAFARAFTGEEAPRLRLHVEGPSMPHRGLGSGTQLGMAVGKAIAMLRGEAAVSASEIARRTGRGRRSAIGVHGFERGGFLVDGGHGSATGGLAPLILRLELPPSWRFVLAVPRSGSGPSGAEEEARFRRLEPAAIERTHALCHALILGMAPAIVENDVRAFGEALFEYGVRAGELYRGAQEGAFASSEVARIVEAIRSEGFPGAGQSSWGPAVYAVTADTEEARRLASRLEERFGKDRVEVSVTEPLQHGASCSTGEELA